MKIFNTLQKLWSYDLYCPICGDICREISVVCGPDGIWKTLQTTKLDNVLKLETELTHKKEKCNVSFFIDCVTNKFEYYISTDCEAFCYAEKAKNSDLFFHLESDCKRCLGSWTISNDVNLNFSTKMVENFSLEGEEVWFDDKFIINYNYMKNVMTIDKVIQKKKLSGDFIDSSMGKPLPLPIVEFDFKNKKKTLNKIKTMLVFS